MTRRRASPRRRIRDTLYGVLLFGPAAQGLRATSQASVLDVDAPEPGSKGRQFLNRIASQGRAIANVIGDPHHGMPDVPHHRHEDFRRKIRFEMELDARTLGGREHPTQDHRQRLQLA